MNIKWSGSHYKILGTLSLSFMAMLLSDKNLSSLVPGILISACIAITIQIIRHPYKRVAHFAFVFHTMLFPEFFAPAFILLPLPLALFCTLLFVGNFNSQNQMLAFGLISIVPAFLIHLLEKNYVDSTLDYLSEHDAHHEYERMFKKLEENRMRDIEQSSRESVLAERNRIARSLHDYIGHTVSSAIMQLEAYKLTHCHPDGEEKINTVIHTLKSGMVDIRSSIHHLYDESLDMQTELNKLKSKYPNVKFSIFVEDGEALRYNMKNELIRIVGELVSNAVRHSDADKIEIILNPVGEYHTLLVKDNGSTFSEEIIPGVGLTGIATFANQHGGSMDYHYKDGFRVHIRLKG